MLINLDNCYKKMDTGSLPELQSLAISQKSPVNWVDFLVGMLTLLSSNQLIILKFCLQDMGAPAAVCLCGPW